MLIVALRDGKVLRLDLNELEDARHWRTVAPTDISSIALTDRGGRCDLPLPKRFRYVKFEASVIRDGDRVAREIVTAYFERGSLSLTMYPNGSSPRFRVDLDGRGQRRFDPSSVVRDPDDGT